MMKKSILFIFIVFVYTISAFKIAPGQTKNELDKYYSQRVNFLTDSVLNYNKLYLDSLFIDFDSTYYFVTEDFKGYYQDSIFSIIKDSINKQRQDSINALSELFLKKIDTIFTEYKSKFQPNISGFESEILKAKNAYSQCIDCEDKEDYYDVLDEYSDILDSISFDFQENTFAVSDSLQVLFADSSASYLEYISDFAIDLMDNQAEVDDETNETISEKSHSYNFQITFDLLFENHTSYLGRDYGTVQKLLSPAITIEHKSGLGISASLYFVDKAIKALDETELSAFYTNDFTDFLNGTLTFSHYWFQDSSLNSKSAVANSLTGELMFDFPYFNFSFLSELDISGKNSEIYFVLSASSPVNISENFLKGELDFEPSVTAAYGLQNSYFYSKKMRIKGILSPGRSKTFGIVDYEISLPLIFTTNYFALKTDLRLIIPLNILDNSTKEPFMNFSAEVSVPFNIR